MANEGFISLTGGIKVSDINSVRNTNSEQTRACNQSDTSFNESLAWFRSNAAVRCYTATENLSASEFRGAQVMTACICTITESYAYYYANNNDGCICICVDPNTITGSTCTDKFFEYSKDGGNSFTTSSNLSTHLFQNLEGGGFGPSHRGGKGFRDYDVRVKDATTGGILSKTVRLTFNSTDNVYTCVQSVDDTSIT